MRIPQSSSLLLATSSLLSAVQANPLPNAETTLNVLSQRALSNSPTGNYAPGPVTCPSGNLVRAASEISTGEKQFIQKRKSVTDVALTDFLNRASMVDFDVAAFMQNYSPTIGIAFSGGGYRAMLTGGGELSAFDSRTPGSTAAGQLGGLLQSSTYIAGLSGGSWLLGSIVINNFTTIERLQAAKNLWDLENSILAPNGALQIIDTAEYYNTLNNEVEEKKNAGFDVSLTDYWARALSRQFVNLTNGGPGVTWSSIALTSEYENAEMPFPIVVADARNPDEILIGGNATVFEFNPLEFGSFDPTLYAFTPIEYIGSNVTNGVPDSNTSCVRGFDNAGFVMGTSSSLFNVGLIELQSSGLTGILRSLAETVLGGLSLAGDDIADYSPNPFFGVNPSTNPSAKQKDLTLVDGGLDLQNIPLQPLIQPARGLDVIFAMDNSADTVRLDGDNSNWPNGTALIASYERSLDPKMANGTYFPAIPDSNTMVNLGLNLRPTFFGCNGSNITTDASRMPPLIVYIPNSPYTYTSNTSTEKMEYSNTERDLMIENGYNIATRGNGTNTQNWPACVGCAIVWRNQERQGLAQTTQCQQCFKDYCWNGTTDSVPLTKDYNPTIAIKYKAGAGRAGYGTGMLIMSGLAGVWLSGSLD
ncbi:Lysophospholipase 1 [Rhizina undulata]